jgi:hypothetical protein
MAEQWLKIEIAPLDQQIVIATKDGRVCQGHIFKVNEAGKTDSDEIGDLRAMLAVADSWGGARAIPIGWQPLPKHPLKEKTMQKLTQCSACGSKSLKWHCGQKNLSGVQDGLFRMHEVGTEFYLGCEACSETLQVVSGDQVAEHLNNSM